MAIWIVEQSHLIDHPHTIAAATLGGLKCCVTRQANHPRKFSWQLPFGPLHFEVNDDQTVVRAFFRDKNGKRKRFMRLRRV